MRTFSIVLALCAATTLAGCKETPAATEEVAVDEPEALSLEQTAAIDALSTEELVQLVRTSSGLEYDYADQRLANILKETTDAELIELATSPRLPFGQAMHQANMAKNRQREASKN